MTRKAVIIGLGIAVLATLIVLVLMPVELPDRSTPPLQAIANNVRQIDSAKLGLALERQITNPAHMFQPEDLIPIISHDGKWIQPIAGERYEIKSLAESPEAILTDPVKHSSGTNYPSGTVVRFSSAGDIEIIIPTNQPAR